MNPRQRRGVIILALAVIAGLATFTVVFRYVAEVNSRVGPETQAWLVNVPVEAWQPIPESAIGPAMVPVRWLPAGAILDPADIIGKVAPAGLANGSLLQEGMVVDPPEIGPDQRELAMTVTGELGLGGNLEPDALVDIMATFPAFGETPQSTRVVASGVRVLRVDTPDDQVGGGGGQLVTFALDSELALEVAYAQSSAIQVRLVLVAPGGGSDTTGDIAVAPGAEDAPLDEEVAP